MAAYGALVSLSHLLHQILHPPPLFTNIIIIHEQQIEFLRAKIELLIDFLETYPSRRSSEIAELEARIRDAAYAAEDIIESNVIDQIHASDLYRRVEASTPSSLTKKFSSFLSKKRKTPILSSQKEIPTQDIETVLEKFITIEKEKEMLTMRFMQSEGDVQLKSSEAPRPPPGGKITMVGFDDHLFRIKSELASDESSRKVIPIVGMGGMGKTTLATAVYNDLFVVEHFHIRAWVTVSQEYSVEEMILCVLSEIDKSYKDREESSKDEPGLRLYKKLFLRKYLIVMDDMWDIQAWDEMKRFLPDNGNGSRVLVTSRLSNLVDDFGSCSPYKLDFLDKGQSWDLFRKKIFAEEDCPVELEEIGKFIVERCGGLPLALVLISGLLSKSERTREHWEVFAGDMSSSLNFGNDEHVMKILSLSYTHLPVYLKPCFLYLAVYPEDFKIGASALIRLWVAEGLIKQGQSKCLEEIAHDYLEDLVSRNLVLAGARGSLGNLKYCKLHDLVRDLCTAQAEKEKFVCIAKLDDPNISPNLKTAHRLSVYSTRGRPLREKVEALQSASLTRSWLSPSLLEDNWFLRMRRRLLTKGKEKRIINGFRFLKVVLEKDRSRLVELLNLSNLRFVDALSLSSVFPMLLCWNLQTLHFYKLLKSPIYLADVPPEIWLMPQLRHLKIGLFVLPDPPDDDENVIVLKNLQTVKSVYQFKCSEHVLKRIPNLKNLEANYLSSEDEDFCLHNLAHFKKLESLELRITDVPKLWQTIAFPVSLKKAELRGVQDSLGRFIHCWFTAQPSLPNLEVLMLNDLATTGEEWNPIEGQFCRLRFLSIISRELKIWGAENYNFPCLERLFLLEVRLEMIPLSFSDISTLQEIQFFWIEESLWTSAKEISNEREQLGYEPLLIQRRTVRYDELSGQTLSLSLSQRRQWNPVSRIVVDEIAP